MPSKQRSGPAPGSLAFNHAMIYVREMEPALRFYAGLLGFGIVETFAHQGRVVYARLRAPRGDGTIALHVAEPGRDLPPSDGVRLYFEIQNLEKFCLRLQAAGLSVDPPKLMPWGWKHVYLNDPAGHEISLYWAGAKRYRKSRMAAEKRK